MITTKICLQNVTHIWLQNWQIAQIIKNFQKPDFILCYFLTYTATYE